jgi:hypothetical protein
MTGQMEKIARMAAKEAVAETFLTMGINVQDAISVQNQFAFLRNLHYSMRHLRNAAIAACVGAVVSGLGWAVWTALKVGTALADKGPAVVKAVESVVK